MLYLVLAPLLLALAVAGIHLGRRWAKQSQDPNFTGDREDVQFSGWVSKGVGFAALGGFLLLTLLSSVYQIEAGHVGVVKTFGSITGQTGDGLTFVAPWSDVTSVSTRVQRQHFEDIEAFSKETQDVTIAATLNLSVSPSAIQNLYRTVGPDWYDKLVPPRVNQTIKDETVKFKSVDIAPNREVIRKEVRDRLQDQLSEYSINVQDFLIDNIGFPKDFTDAILRKQVATQDAQTAENKVKVAEAEARQKVATAQGDAGATLVNATAQAKANKKLAQSLTQELIQFTAIQKLNPNVTTVILPSGSNFLLPSSIMGGK